MVHSAQIFSETSTSYLSRTAAMQHQESQVKTLQLQHGDVYLKLKHIMTLKGFTRASIDYINHFNISSFKLNVRGISLMLPDILTSFRSLLPKLERRRIKS